MRFLAGIIIDVITWFTGRAWVYDVAAWRSEKEGKFREALEFRNFAIRERMKRELRRRA